mmetsp:Transcript_7015/g.11734  ORF Transcript_7015/g.11734 Transcript_7015/m.11734 type:complete len:201 (-) Transcript_7015:52-654(-)
MGAKGNAASSSAAAASASAAAFALAAISAAASSSCGVAKWRVKVCTILGESTSSSNPGTSSSTDLSAGVVEEFVDASFLSFSTPESKGAGLELTSSSSAGNACDSSPSGVPSFPAVFSACGGSTVTESASTDCSFPSAGESTITFTSCCPFSACSPAESARLVSSPAGVDSTFSNVSASIFFGNLSKSSKLLFSTKRCLS